ncbi:MAG: class I SAM-dependent methyltransferase [Verrucomicrobiales bacterium]|nr:class I SAM-dependent methyltransferase [Verrucomicrobiales bacterium]
MRGNPIAYTEKKKAFLGVDFFVDERVYVPNDETEKLVEYAVSHCLEDNCSGRRVVVDVGTGCGCLAISAARMLPEFDVIATDISEEALEVARINVNRSGISRVQLVKTDLIEAVVEEPAAVMANLPWGSEAYLLKGNKLEELQCMPRIATFPEDGVLGAYIRLIEMIKRKCWSTILFAEVGCVPEEVVFEELAKAGLGSAEDSDASYERIGCDDYGLLKVCFRDAMGNVLSAG